MCSVRRRLNKHFKRPGSTSSLRRDWTSSLLARKNKKCFAVTGPSIDLPEPDAPPLKLTHQEFLSRFEALCLGGRVPSDAAPFSHTDSLSPLDEKHATISETNIVPVGGAGWGGLNPISPGSTRVRLPLALSLGR